MQAEIAMQLGELCDEEPSPELRERVLKAVAKAIELDSPAPLASIGRGVHDYDPRFDSETGDRDDDRDWHQRDRDRRSDRRLTLSGQFWRAASFVLLGVVVVCVFGMVQVWRSHHDLTMAIVGSNTYEQLEGQIGPTVKDYLKSPDTVRVVLSADTDACEECWANLLILEGSDQALLITEGLPELEEGQTYQLRVQREGGSMVTIDRITSGTTLVGHRVVVNAASTLANATWELTGPNGVVLRGTRA